MSELEDKLNSILSSPKEMEKIMEIARSFSGFSDASPGESADTKDEPVSAASGPDPKLLKAFSRIMGSYSGMTDDKSALLRSMRPYLKEGRLKQIDKAMEVAKMAKLAKIAFSEFSGGDQDL